MAMTLPPSPHPPPNSCSLRFTNGKSPNRTKISSLAICFRGLKVEAASGKGARGRFSAIRPRWGGGHGNGTGLKNCLKASEVHIVDLFAHDNRPSSFLLKPEVPLDALGEGCVFDGFGELHAGRLNECQQVSGWDGRSKVSL